MREANDKNSTNFVNGIDKENVGCYNKSTLYREK